MKRALLFALLICVECKRSGMGRIEGLRDDLANNDTTSAVKDLPACGESKDVPNPCMTELANAFGSKSGYHEEPPDQASAAAVATVVARDANGHAAGHPEAWIKVVRISKGAGPDALRVATAQRLQSIAKTYGHAIETEEEARKLMKDVSALAGACDTYVDLAAGKKDEELPLTEQADHSPCVQRDLSRKLGPGGTYGFGFWRAAMGALSLARDYADALEEGSKLTTSKLPPIKVTDFDAIQIKKVETPDANRWSEHANVPPVPVPISKDGGRD